jgi:hypothetical protein
MFKSVIVLSLLYKVSFMLFPFKLFLIQKRTKFSHVSSKETTTE